MKINGVDHLSIAVKDLAAARRIWEPILGRERPDEIYVNESEGIRVARYRIGSVGFELMESLNPDGAVARFIERRGEGVMVVALHVDDTRAAMAELTARGYPFIGDARPFRGGEFAFVHPKAASGVLLELIDDGAGS